MSLPPRARPTTALRAPMKGGDGIPWLEFVFLAAAGAVALRPLAQFWVADPDYAFGWGVPFLAAYLFAARWRIRPEPRPVRGSAYLLIIGLIAWGAAFLFSRLLVEVVPDWRPNLWLVASLYVGAAVAWCWLRGGRAWSRHFLFPIGFLFCSVPWPYNLESPIVQGLMRWNAVMVADTLVLADIPARAAGNTLLLPTGQLGIEEACSGLRSLQAALMMGLFLGAFYHFSPRKRWLLLLLATIFALVGNYLRLLVLAGRAVHDGISSAAAIHDSAGGGILVFTVFGLWIACLTLRDRKDRIAEECIRSANSSREPHQNRFALRWASGIFIAVLASEALTRSWFAWRNSSMAMPVAWTVRWPEGSSNYHPTPISAATHQLLGDDHSYSGSWTTVPGLRWRAMWFSYPPRAANRIAADLHNPEVCLSGGGFREEADYGRFPLPGKEALPPVHAYLFSSNSQSDFVFWISSADSAADAAPSSDRSQIIYGRTIPAFFGRLRLWGGEAWRGARPVSSQTLEVSIEGAPNYAEARRSFLAFADNAIITPQSGDTTLAPR